MKRMRWFFSVAVLFFGIITIDLESLKWSVLGLSLYSLPLLLQFTKREEFHIWALWGGIFLIIQSFLSPDLISNNFKTLQPNTHRILNVKSGIPGINGKQIITTDSKGFRTTKEIDYQNDKTYRIFAI
jgi:hypothetical protein